MLAKIKFDIFFLLLILSSSLNYSQTKFLNDLSNKGYRLSYCETHEILKSKIDKTIDFTKEVIYTKIGDVLYGMIFTDKYHGDSVFHENIKTNKLYWYNIDFLDIGERPISYETYVKNVYSCFNIDFKKNIISEYIVFYMFRDISKNITTCSFSFDTIRKTGFTTKESIPIPDFNNPESIKNFDDNFDRIEIIKKITLEPQKIKDYRPLIFYYFVCLLESSPTKCSEKDFIDKVF